MSKVLGRGKFLKLVRDGHWEYVDRVNAYGAVAIVAVTPDRRLVLVEQFRLPLGRLVIELPAGIAGDVPGQEDESYETSARRELAEETGYIAKQLEHVADCPSSPGLTSEVISIFAAFDLRRKDSGGGVDGEKIEVHTPLVRGIDRWLAKQAAAGKLIDTKVYAGLYFARRQAALRRAKSRRKS